MLRSISGSHRQRRLFPQQAQRFRLPIPRGYQSSAGVQLKTIVVGTVIGTLINSLVLLPATLAETVQLGVVISPDNQGQWSGITRRLLSTGIDYCVVDFAQVQQASDLGSTKLLFLPNIEQLQPIQLSALQEWMRQGGKVIVSGPLGTMSQPEIRTQLRSLLGAYWGFALKAPSTLKPTQTITQNLPSTGTIQGGVVIPGDATSTTAAVWSQTDNPPAVVTTDQSTFLGWRWGVDGVAPAEVDSAWLRVTLNHYNITPASLRTEPAASQKFCVPSQAATASLPATPFPTRNGRDIPQGRPNAPTRLTSPLPRGQSLPSTTGSIAQIEPDVGVAPPQATPDNKRTLTARELSAMGQELENLIGRFQSALLAANATSSNVNLQTGVATQQDLIASTGRASRPDNAQTAMPTPTDSASRVVAEARTGLQRFRDAIARADYNEARQQWIQARRLLWDNYPTDRKLAQPEIRAIWLDRGTIVRAKSEQDLAKIFDQLATAGFNTVFFETVNASYPIYPSRLAPQNPLVQGWDPLAAAVKLAHERGMELHAWVWMFAAANRRHNLILNQRADYPGPVLAAHPDWGIVDRQGRLFDQNTKKAFLDPANPEVRRYLMSLLDEITSNYQVDGIQLDYIRYPFQDPSAGQVFGYSKLARQQFRELTGVDPIAIYPSNRELWQKWTDFRIHQIDEFVATVRERLRLQRPNLILSAAVFPLPRAERLQRLQQNWEDWANRGDIDLLVPMTYALDSKGLQTLAQPVLAESTLGSALILPGIRLLNLPDVVAVDQIQLLRDLSAGGFALFAVENLDSNLLSIFSRTQGKGSPSASEPVPYRQPFSTAAARYTALQREWSFLLANRQILIQESALSEWSKQANVLGELLNKLAAEPSKPNLLAAKSSLLAFRSQFQRWMLSPAVEQPYRVQVWDNRLATIEQLLRYGERTALGQDQPKVTR